MEFYPQLNGHILIAVTWDNCDIGPTPYSVIEDRAAELGNSATIRRCKFSEYGDEHLALYVRCTMPV